MVNVCVTGIGLTSALGSNTEKVWQALLAGQSALMLRQPFFDLGVYPLGLIGKTPEALPPLLLSTVAQALEDANLQRPQSDCGVVVGSSRSHQADWERLGHQTQGHLQGDLGELSTLWKPPWLATLPHMPAIATAQYLQSTGPLLAPMAACATGLWSIIQGYDLIRSGHCDRVVVGAVETPITPLTLVGFEKMGALAKTGCYPFDINRAGLVLGEAAAILVLEAESVAIARKSPNYGHILGFGATADGHHVSAPDPQRTGGITAIIQCLQRSDIEPEAVDYIHAHGTSTRLNDQNEADLIAQCFPHRPAVSSTKGATGHTLGASGALGLAFCLLAMRDRVLPPCTGLRSPAFDLNFVRRAQTADINTALCMSFGFGGQNVVVAVRGNA
ncbi:MAG: beta-ketoacyl-ACP synthase [Cyanobacteria bacterium P01_A01_bin.123]